MVNLLSEVEINAWILFIGGDLLSCPVRREQISTVWEVIGSAHQLVCDYGHNKTYFLDVGSPPLPKCCPSSS